MSANSDNYDSVIWAIYIVIFFAGYHYFHGNEQTIYREACSTKFVDGTCSGKITPMPRQMYKVSFESQTVVARWLSDGQAPYSLKSCSVIDEENWICEGDERNKHHIMVSDGIETETDVYGFPIVGIVTKQISKWKWYFLKATDWINPN